MLSLILIAFQEQLKQKRKFSDIHGNTIKNKIMEHKIMELRTKIIQNQTISRGEKKDLYCLFF